MNFRQIVLRQQEPNPREATGEHAEILSALNEAASHLISLIQLERRGIYDTNGETGTWSGKDPVLRGAVKILALAQRRAVELGKDAAQPG
jgi:hypothetical protein